MSAKPVLTLSCVPPPFSQLLSELKKSRNCACDGDITWVKASKLRARVFEAIEKRDAYQTITPNKLKTFCIVNAMWRTCMYTAPIALTQIAPVDSYQEDEEAFFKLTMSFSSLSPALKETEFGALGIKANIELFDKTLKAPIQKDHGIAIACNLYHGTHVFIIEKRADDCYTIYQSYLSISEMGSYSFENFLEDTSKHAQWNSQELVKSIAEVISKDTDWEERLRAYEKLFFASLTKNELQSRDSLCKYPFIFVETKPYLLGSSKNLPE